jgi:hypothetical protein
LSLYILSKSAITSLYFSYFKKNLSPFSKKSERETFNPNSLADAIAFYNFVPLIPLLKPEKLDSILSIFSSSESVIVLIVNAKFGINDSIIPLIESKFISGIA